jgi:hypothetical protein
MDYSYGADGWYCSDNQWTCQKLTQFWPELEDTELVCFVAWDRPPPEPHYAIQQYIDEGNSINDMMFYITPVKRDALDEDFIGTTEAMGKWLHNALELDPDDPDSSADNEVYITIEIRRALA